MRGRETRAECEGQGEGVSKVKAGDREGEGLDRFIGIVGGREEIYGFTEVGEWIDSEDMRA